MKAEEGICNGKVLYHRYVKKSAEEEAVQAAAIKSREDLREKRRRQQVGPITWFGQNVGS